MLTNSFKNAKRNGKSIFDKFIFGMSMPVHADEEPPTPDPVTDPAPAPGKSPSTQVNFEEMIARVRREEKDKLYGKIKKLEDEVSTLRESNNGYILQIASYQARLEEAQKKNDPEEVKKLNDKISELTSALEEAKKNTPDEKAIRAQVEAEYEVKMYTQTKLTEQKDNILSAFVGTVTGKTKEEVDAAITAAVEKSTAVKKELGLIDEDGKPVGGKKKSDKEDPAPGKKKTSPPTVNPAAVDEEAFDPDYIRNLDPRSPEYAEFRKKMGLH